MKGSAVTIIALLAFWVPGGRAAQGTLRQHQEWMRKFETPGGTLRGVHPDASLMPTSAEPARHRAPFTANRPMQRPADH
jgi:hypothetical protein